MADKTYWTRCYDRELKKLRSRGALGPSLFLGDPKAPRELIAKSAVLMLRKMNKKDTRSIDSLDPEKYL